MNPMVLTAATVSLAAGVAMAADAGTAESPRTSVTIYSSAQPGAVDPAMYRPVRGQPAWGGPVPGTAMVREVRRLDLALGASDVRFTDVAALIDPTTVSFTSLTDPEGTSVLEQAFRFDLVSPERLLERAIDRPVEVLLDGHGSGGAGEGGPGAGWRIVRGTLLSAAGGALTLRREDGSITVLNGYEGVHLADPGAGLVTRPELRWRVSAARGGTHDVRVAYETQGITWWADYTLLYTPIDANRGTLDLSAWVSILNQSGATFQDARLKLIAGDVNRAAPARPLFRRDRGFAAHEMAALADAGFEQRAFFEYHMYTLGRIATIPDNATKQIELFPTARGIPAEKVLVFDGSGGFWGDGVFINPGMGAGSPASLDVFLRFRNDEASKLGMPLPAGRLRVNQVDPADGVPEFVGEDVIRHTPRDEMVMVKMGRSFDVVGERRQVDFRADEARRTMEETIEVVVRNRKQEPVSLVVQERMQRARQWEFVGDAPAHTRLDARTVHFPLTLTPGQEGTVRFRVRYTW